MIDKIAALLRLTVIVTTLILSAFWTNASTAESLSAVLDGGQGNLGQLFALTDDKQRMPDRTQSIYTAQAAYARIYLHYYPEVLDDDGTVEVLARNFFAEEVTQTQRSAEYRSSPFKRRSIINEWRQRLLALETPDTLTLDLYVAVMVHPAGYDFEAQSFPSKRFSLTEETLLHTGVPGFTCLKLDRTFDFKSYEVPESDAQQFIADNRNSRVAGSGASVFVGLQLQITGKPEMPGAERPRCAMAAKVLEIDAVEYRSAQDFSIEYARPGNVMKTYYSSAAPASDSADSLVQVTYENREQSTESPPEALEFNLETRQGMIVFPAEADGRIWWNGLEKPGEAHQALFDYGNFLMLGVYPEAYDPVRAARCMTTKYLTAEDDSMYFSARAYDWRGSTEFEKKRSEAAFREAALPKLAERAVNTPQRLLVVGTLYLPEYDFENQGFLLQSLFSATNVKNIHAECGGGIGLLPMASQFKDFWNIAPAAAEAMLNNIAISHQAGTMNIRYVYLATEVELVNLVAARPKQPNPNSVEPPPLRMRIMSSTLYADRELTQAIYSPTIVRAAPSVLEAGIPDSVSYSSAYQRDYGGPDQLRQLKERGSFEDWEYESLMHQQMGRDTYYYSVIRSHSQAPHQLRSPLLEHDEEYTPFYPNGLADRRGGLQPHRMTDEQKALFVEWAKRQAAILP